MVESLQQTSNSTVNHGQRQSNRQAQRGAGEKWRERQTSEAINIQTSLHMSIVAPMLQRVIQTISHTVVA